MESNITIGFICSTNGSTLKATWNIIKSCFPDIKFVVVSDRECGAIDWCNEVGIQNRIFTYESSAKFSERAHEFLVIRCKVKAVLLLFTKIVGPELYNRCICLNIHPSLLPSFSGLNAFQKTMRSGCRFFGTTLHIVTKEIDKGPILAQTISPTNLSIPLRKQNSISFAQKVYLTLLGIEKLLNPDCYNGCNFPNLFLGEASAYANPLITSPDILKNFQSFVDHHSINWPMK